MVPGSEFRVPGPVESTSAPKERKSELEPGLRLERRVPSGLTIVFYAFAAAAAWIWLRFSHPGLSKSLWTPAHPARDAAIGAGMGLAIVALSQALLKKLSWLRALESEFGWILGRQPKWTIPILALMSAVAEEYLFRGAIQAIAGVWIAAIVFAAFHVPFNRNVRLWPVFAGPIGLLFGWVTIWTGNLIAPILAHLAINAINLWVVTSRFHDWNEEQVARYVEKGA